MSELDYLQRIIESSYEQRAQLTPNDMSDDLDDAIAESLALLDSGTARVAEKPGAGGWVLNAWLKKAVLLYVPHARQRAITRPATRTSTTRCR